MTGLSFLRSKLVIAGIFTADGLFLHKKRFPVCFFPGPGVLYNKHFRTPINSIPEPVMKYLSAPIRALTCLVFVFLCTAPLYAMKFETPFDMDNCNVTIRVGLFDAPGGKVDICVKAEGRRLVFYAPDVNLNAGSTKDVAIKKLPSGDHYEITFSVNTRTPEIPNGGRVSLKPDEIGHPRWDNVLSIDDLSFTTADGKPLQPLYYTVELTPNANAVTVYLAGDSTVCDQGDEPWATWGMMLQAFFAKDTAVANHAESGLSLASFIAQKRLDKILSTMKEGDYVMIQFGHNDQKETGPEAGADRGYSKRLASMIDAVKAKGAHPVVVTPVERRRFRDSKPYGTLQDYAAAAKRVAAGKEVPVIDLNAMSLNLYEALGEEGSKNAFVHYPANTFPNQPQALKDDTHHNPYGGFELAKCVVQGIKDNVPDLARRLRPGIPDFDPAKPDDFTSFRLPASGKKSAQKPDGQ